MTASLRQRAAGAFAKTEAHGDRAVYAVHHRVRQLAHALAQARFIDRADLLKQYNRFLSKSKALQIICAVIFLVAYTVYAAPP